MFRNIAENPDTALTTVQDVWDFPGADTYTYSATADIDTVSSSGAGDTGNLVIYGLDANFEEVKQTVTLTGQTKVTLPTPLIRVNDMQYLTTIPTVGDIYCYVDGTITAGVPGTAADVRGYIAVGNNRSKCSSFTVPAGKVAFMDAVTGGISRRQAATAEISYLLRTNGYEFINVLTLAFNSVGNNLNRFVLDTPFILDEKTDLKAASTADAAGAGVLTNYVFILIDKDLVNTDAIF
jgi:hypothetical protein